MKFSTKLIVTFSALFALFAVGMVVAAQRMDGGAYMFFAVEIFAAALGAIIGLASWFGNSVRQMRDKRTERLKHEMTGNIAHELRTPVTSIRGFLEIVLGNPLDEERRRQYLERAYAQTQTLSALISDMSLLARIDEKKAIFSFADVDAEQLLEKVRRDTATGLTEKHIRLTVEIAPGLTFRGNDSLLYSVFRNLVDNVAAHAGTGVHILVQIDPEGNVVFADTGRGVPSEEHLERIFERFYRVNEGRTRDTGGSGLGLSIVRNAVALHGGTISVERNLPSGLKFNLKLPVKRII